MNAPHNEYKPPHDLRISKHPILPINFFIISSFTILIAFIYTISYHLFSSNNHLIYTFDIVLTCIYLYTLHPLSNRIKVFLLFLTLILFSILYLITKKIFISYHLFILLTLLPYLLIVFANKYLLDIPYALFANIQVSSLYNIDLFSSTQKETNHHEKELIYIDVFSLSEEFEDENYKKIKTHYIRFIKFWYIQKNYIFKLRYYFPTLALILGISIFYLILFTIRTFLPSINYLENMLLMTLYLAIFYLSVTFHINSFLQSKFYMGNILYALNKIYFDTQEYRHQLKFFLDKNFLIYIHDRHYDRHTCVNTNKDFQKFISKEKYDKEGRNSILTVFLSFILILFIEVTVNIQPTSFQNQSHCLHQDNNTTREGKTS